jgi:cytochrome c553
LNCWQRICIAACFSAAMTQAAPLVAVEDSMAQRMQACTGCHGPQGRAASDGYQPRIAGKAAGYLYHQLLNFRDGRRPYVLMTQLLAPLSDSYLRDIAEHFARLEVPYLPAASTAVNAKTNSAEWARGEALVQRGDAALKLPACAQCHGNALMGVVPAIPALLGLPRDYLNAQLGAWRTGARHAMAPDCMAQIAQRLAPTDIAALSLWLSAQTVPTLSKPAASLPAALPLACGGVTATIASP